MQGFNMGRYVPPDLEGVASANQASGKGHALGARASKLRSEGILTVRFEMPFAVWCGHCTPPVVIGQGVRFNAEKKKVGNYYSSPVYSFRMRHAACGGLIEVRTDPKNTAYVVVEGGRKRDTGEDKAGEDSLVGDGVGVPAIFKTAREQAEEREAAFSNLEKTIADRAALAAARERIDEIEDANAKQWDDPYTRNQMLRKTFRVGRKQREKDSAAAEDIKDRMGLGIELLPESEEDARWAKLVDFGTAPEGLVEEGDKALAKPLFGGTKPAAQEKNTRDRKTPTKKLLKSEIAASKMRTSLVSEIVGNTRKAIDPFLEPRTRDNTKNMANIIIPGLKRKRPPGVEPSPPPEDKPSEKVAVTSSALVDYDSD